MNPPIPNCEVCGSLGTFQNKDGARCHSHWMFWPNPAERLAGYVGAYGSIVLAQVK